MQLFKNIVLYMLALFSAPLLLQASHVPEEKGVKEKEAFAREVHKTGVAREKEVRADESLEESALLKAYAHSVKTGGEESLDDILAAMDDDEYFAGYDSLAAMDEVVRHSFAAGNKQTTRVAIPVNTVIKKIREYLEICEKRQQGKGVFVEKQYVDQRKILGVGDLHGSISALLGIFDSWVAKGWMNDNYTLAPGVHVVFLGDNVDRGQGGIEVLTLLLCLKIKNWSQVTLIRGNHEDWDMNIAMGFEVELANKYPGNLYQFKADTARPQDSLIPRVYETFPLAAFLAGGKSSAPENLSYVLCLHGMVDEILLKATEEILKREFPRDSEKKITFQNSENHQYVSPAVMWGDIQQHINPEQPIEAATREKREKTGRACVNQAWLEEKIFTVYPQIKLMIRGHQHAITDGVLFNVATWTDLQRDLPAFHAKSKAFNFPYPQGPFSAEALEAICKGYCGKDYAFVNCWGKVLTTSAAQNIDPTLPVKRLRYLFLLPGATPQLPWEIRVDDTDKSSKPLVLSTQKIQLKTREKEARKVVTSASTTSATSSSASAVLSENLKGIQTTSGASVSESTTRQI